MFVLGVCDPNGQVPCDLSVRTHPVQLVLTNDTGLRVVTVLGHLGARIIVYRAQKSHRTPADNYIETFRFPRTPSSRRRLSEDTYHNHLTSQAVPEVPSFDVVAFEAGSEEPVNPESRGSRDTVSDSEGREEI